MPKQRPMKWVLPEVVDPPETVCFQINVPKDRQHIAAFYGAIFLLSKPYAWADDPAHTAIDVGRVWRRIFDDLIGGNCTVCPPSEPMGIDIGGADVELRLKPGDSCVIQINCAGEWEDWYDPRGCLPASIAQPPAGGTLEPGQCLEYDVVLYGNNVWHIPVQVNNGDTIEVTNTAGGWGDGTIGGYFCPNGVPNVLSFCIGSPGFSGSDPVPSAYHMELVGIYGSQSRAMDNQTVILSGLSGPADFMFQANDDTLSDNNGSISFHVKVCSGQSNCVNMTYLLGASGPAQVCIGDEFDYSVAVFDGAAWNGGIDFDQCCSLTLISQTGAVVTGATYKDCGGTLHSGFNLTSITELGTNSSIGSFTLHLRLDSIP